jgi:hypothetical protein
MHLLKFVFMNYFLFNQKYFQSINPRLQVVSVKIIKIKHKKKVRILSLL